MQGLVTPVSLQQIKDSVALLRSTRLSLSHVRSDLKLRKCHWVFSNTDHGTVWLLPCLICYVANRVLRGHHLLVVRLGHVTRKSIDMETFSQAKTRSTPPHSLV